MFRITLLAVLALMGLGLAACQKADDENSTAAIRKEKMPPAIHYYQISEQ